MARPALALGGIALIGLGVVMGFGWWWPSSAEASGEVGAPIREVRIDNDNGTVKVHTANVTQTTVRQSFSYQWSKPGDAYKVDGERLVLGGCGWNCSVDYDVTVPLNTSVTGHVDSGGIELTGVASADVKADSGSVKITDVAGLVKVNVDSGDIDLSGIGQDIDVKTSSGSISGDRLRGKAEAKTDSGSIKLSLDTAQDVTAQADSGSVKITVPKDRYQVKGSTDSGSRDIDVVNDESAPRTLQLDTDSGDVTVNVA
ncbi:DUF4097 domain-containing protein [Amycolatopsis sp. cg5]|uniref:DUF4097 family beta strand repeat-containing protein n=1 Tax=Amycolatopsis sp. cg5 TaxID=3238802 RepID=UPI0035243FAF